MIPMHSKLFLRNPLAIARHNYFGWALFYLFFFQAQLDLFPQPGKILIH